MLSKKSLSILILSIVGFSGVYLFYVKSAREASIKKYIGKPRVGDIYKMQTTSRQNGVVIFFLKIKDIGKEGIYFYPGRLSGGAINDSFMNQYDTTQTEVYSKKDLNLMAAGTPSNETTGMTMLLEIERK